MGKGESTKILQRTNKTREKRRAKRRRQKTIQAAYWCPEQTATKHQQQHQQQQQLRRNRIYRNIAFAFQNWNITSTKWFSLCLPLDVLRLFLPSFAWLFIIFRLSAHKHKHRRMCVKRSAVRVADIRSSYISIRSTHTLIRVQHPFVYIRSERVRITYMKNRIYGWCLCVRVCVPVPVPVSFFTFHLTRSLQPFTHFLYEWLAAICLSLSLFCSNHTHTCVLLIFWVFIIFHCIAYVWALSVCVCAWLFSFFYSLAALALLTFSRGNCNGEYECVCVFVKWIRIDFCLWNSSYRIVIHTGTAHTTPRCRCMCEWVCTHEHGVCM